MTICCLSGSLLLDGLQQLRQALLITQKELAELLSVSVVTVNRWENNKFEPTMKEKRKLVKLFKDNGIGE